MNKKITSKLIAQKINRNFKKHIVRKFARARLYKPYNNHYIFADPRGGSTWMMEIIQNITDEPVIWEPLDFKIKNNPFNDLNFGWRQHIPEAENWEEAKHLFNNLFSGKILSQNILDYSTFSQLQNSQSLLFKICRGNALLPWLTRNFEFKYKPIYLVRHPFAVVFSQLKHGAWDYPFTNFHFPDTPFNDNYKEHKKFLDTIEYKEEALVAEWCMSNLITLNNPKNNINWITINYEEFVMNPENTLKRILTEWQIDYDISKIDFKKNSVTTKKDTPDSKIKRLSSWQKNLNSKQLKHMKRVFDYFEVDFYIKENPFPEKVF